MKFVVKQIVMAVATLMFVAPAFAADNNPDTPRMPTKGTKSYQMAHAKPAAQETAEATTAQDVSQIAPAAGDTAPMETQGKTLREEMRLPRKD